MKGDECAERFSNIWPQFKIRILEQAPLISKSTTLKSLRLNEFGFWDSDVLALFNLLHLIPPTAQGRAKGIRCSAQIAQSRLLQFFQTGTPLTTITENWDMAISHSCLVGFGPSSNHLEQFFISIDGSFPLMLGTLLKQLIGYSKLILCSRLSMMHIYWASGNFSLEVFIFEV